MRLMGIACALLLGIAANARADVFVPDDPLASEAGCVAAAGDVIVTAFAPNGEEREIQVSAAGGPWQHLPTGAIEDCPKAAAAADGTVAIAAGGRLYVQRNGTFAAPVELSYDVQDLAVAPGGWVVAAGQRLTLTRHDQNVKLLATTVAPDGTARSAVLDRDHPAKRGSDIPEAPRAGVDAQGRATVVWTVWRASSATYDIYSAAPGGPARLLARDVLPIYDAPDTSQVDVAVTPSGHTLLAWADEKGIVASFDGGAAQRVNHEALAGSPVAELTEDGTALIASVTRDAVLTTDRAGTGPWVTHALAHLAPAAEWDARPEIGRLSAALAPDGRAAVAWGDQRLTAATGRAGLAWEPGVALSAVTRAAASPSLTLSPAGDPRLVWVERAGDDPGRLRGARLAAHPVADTTAPVLTTTLPTRTPRTKTGVVTLRIPVSCSEACDAAVRLLDRRGTPLAETVRELAPGRQQTFAVRTNAFTGLQMAGDRRLRHPRLDVVVTDRAGNVARAARTVAFQIVDRPLLDYRVTPGHDFAMFTAAGDRAVARLVNDLIAGLARGTIKSERELRRRYVRGRAAIRAKHDEIDDTEVGDAIFEALYVPCKRRGYDPEYVVSG